METVQQQLAALEEALQQTEQYQSVKSAIEGVRANEESAKTFDTFRKVQALLQKRQMEGQEPSEQEMMNAQSTAVLVQQDEKIMKIFEAEENLAQVMQQINMSLLSGIQEAYDSLVLPEDEEK